MEQHGLRRQDVPHNMSMNHSALSMNLSVNDSIRPNKQLALRVDVSMKFTVDVRTSAKVQFAF